MIQCEDEAREFIMRIRNEPLDVGVAVGEVRLGCLIDVMSHSRATGPRNFSSRPNSGSRRLSPS